tara:strand:- start:40 stop:201 length:162 start_codon:yes stop_codon:yes gene_type:complete
MRHPINSGATILEWREKKSLLSNFLITESILTNYIFSGYVTQSLESLIEERRR